jgi:hypothetical protein
VRLDPSFSSHLRVCVVRMSLSLTVCVQGLESSYFLSRGKALEKFPMLKHDRLVGAMVYYDGWWCTCTRILVWGWCVLSALVPRCVLRAIFPLTSCTDFVFPSLCTSILPSGLLKRKYAHAHIHIHTHTGTRTLVIIFVKYTHTTTTTFACSSTYTHSLTHTHTHSLSVYRFLSM